jgi:CubicO group peptidase (beta-lactamase class C family)
MKSIKRLFLVLLVLLSAKHGSSQTAENEKYEEVTKRITTLYNKQDYKGIYSLFSPSFKKEMSEEDLTTFLSGTLKANYGRMKSITFVKKEGRDRFYRVDFDKGSLELTLVCNPEYLIDGLFFQPPPDTTPERRSEYKSGNRKQTELDNEVDRIVTGYMSNSITAGLSIVVIKDDSTFFYHYGETKKGSGNLPCDTTIYEIGSVSKTFTGLLLAKALEDKKLALDDDIRTYLPASCSKLAYKKQPITIKHLVNHTSGLPRVTDDLEKQPDYDSLNPYKNYSRQMVYDYLGDLKLKVAPGSVQDYSNTGMALLGIIIEKVYDMSYADLVEQYIARPFEMKHTFVNVPGGLDFLFANGYDSEGNETPHWDLGDLAGAGGIKSTISDMSKYMIAQLKDEKDFVRLSHQSTWQNGASGTQLAWFTQKLRPGYELVWHNGGTFGFVSFCGFFKEKQLGVVVLCNTSLEGEADEIGVRILQYLQK